MKNKKLLFGILFSFIIGPVFCDTVPGWYKSLEKVYPIDKYIRAMGEGSTEKKAQAEAIANVAMSFKTSVKVLNTAISDLQNSVENDKTDYSQKETIHREFFAETESEFYCLQFSESYYDKKRKKYFTVAFIDRENAFGIYNSKIIPLETEMISTYNGAAEESEYLYKCFLYQKASLLGELIKVYINNAIIVCPSKANAFDGVLEQISAVNYEAEKQRNKISFSIECKEPKGQNLVPGIASILEESGFVYSKKNPVYKIDVEIQFSEEVYEAGEFVRPAVTIMISNKDGEPVDSYSRVYPRYTYGSMENSYNLAVLRVQQDLEENFLSSYRTIVSEE